MLIRIIKSCIISELNLFVLVFYVILINLLLVSLSLKLSCTVHYVGIVRVEFHVHTYSAYLFTEHVL